MFTKSASQVSTQIFFNCLLSAKNYSLCFAFAFLRKLSNFVCTKAVQIPYPKFFYYKASLSWEKMQAFFPFTIFRKDIY